MAKSFQPLFTDAYFRAVWADEYAKFRDSPDEQALIKSLQKWQGRAKNLTEVQEEGSFMDVFFKQLWDYRANGETNVGEGFTRHPKYKVAGAGQSGGMGEADLALGWFGRPDVPTTPQVLCEFKDIRSSLDAAQNRKGNTRSPVKQCADYLREAGKELYGNESILPTWGIVTDMNEFRLYWRNRMPAQYQRFVITPATTDSTAGLLSKSEAGSFQRFLFGRLFHANMLLTTGGECELLKLLHKQWMRDKEIENEFYGEYKGYRVRIYNTLVAYNKEFGGTRGRLVRLAQKLIDRCIFVLFCEDMGEALSFPPNALRDFLKDFSKATYYDPSAQDVWNKLKELFHAMDKGDKFLGKRINRFNGGLFAKDPDLDALFIPNHVFCEKLQGENEAEIVKHPHTLLYLSAVYNFGTSDAGAHAITLYTLGRIFEQSITELEAMEAEAEGQVSLTKETKRKRDGVYYTPEWIVQHIVEETLGSRLEEIRAELGWSIEVEGDGEYVRKQKELPPSGRSQKFNTHVEAVKKYRVRLENFKVCDPACGSGAFLIHVLEYLLKERLRASQEYARVTRKGEGLFEASTEKEIREILSRNIYGVDINPSSVEIAKLALWLHTAKPDQALCDLDQNIRDGNSLVGPEFGNFKQLSILNADKQDEINVFDWEVAFPKVFDKENPDGKGFDCIVGNPPYVKLQNFRKKYAEVAEFLRNGKRANNTPVYFSTQKGNFDLFLPFIERSINLLNEQGRLGFIAPSLWRYNEYGEGLRKVLYDGRYLDRWIDFGSFQIFDEAITYTALQFYSKKPKQNVHFAFAHTGSVSDAADWDDPNWQIAYSDLPITEPWILIPRNERGVIEKMRKHSLRLDDEKVTSAIFQGLKTSADWAYHFYLIGGEHFYCLDEEGKRRDLEIEPAALRPLMSGDTADRYCDADADRFILFPYKISGDDAVLMSPSEMQQKFPKAWSYLKSIENDLRNREEKSFDDENWYRFGRNQNISKQDKAKLGVSTTVKRMEVFADHKGEFCFSGARVEGVLPFKSDEAMFLMAVLNSKPVSFVFRRIGRPKSGGFFEANKQFIAPLPIPKATATQKKDLSRRALELQASHTDRRKKLRALDKRFTACAVKKRKEEWLFPMLGSIEDWKTKAPKDLGARDKAKWATEHRNVRIDSLTENIEVKLASASKLGANYSDGELVFKIDEAPVLDRIFLNEPEGRLTATYWQYVARTTSLTESLTGKSLLGRLAATPVTDNSELLAQIHELNKEIASLDANIASSEAQVDELVYDLFSLTPEERKLVEKDCA